MWPARYGDDILRRPVAGHEPVVAVLPRDLESRRHKQQLELRREVDVAGEVGNEALGQRALVEAVVDQAHVGALQVRLVHDSMSRMDGEHAPAPPSSGAFSRPSSPRRKPAISPRLERLFRRRMRMRTPSGSCDPNQRKSASIGSFRWANAIFGERHVNTSRTSISNGIIKGWGIR